MSCKHRFLNDLFPQGKLQYLFIGTFNPDWDRPQNDNANWFYGRQYNDFWYIMPQVFECQSLMNRDFRTNREYLLNWCKQHQIGLTDLIQSIEDADINNPRHKEIILSVNDNAFDAFEHIGPTNIKAIINANAPSLLGVYLTRYEHTLAQDSKINTLWVDIKTICEQLNIHCHDLVTPSRQFRTKTRDQKLNDWKQTITLNAH